MLRQQNPNQDVYDYGSQTINFEVFVKDCRWLMRLGTHDENVYDNRVVSFDGEDSYLLLNYETRQRLNATRGQPVLNVGDGAVRKGGIPLFNFADEAGALWLAFASECYFATHGSAEQQPVPFCYLGIRLRSLTTSDQPEIERAILKLSQKRPFTPSYIAYYVPDVASYIKWSPSALPSGVAFTNVLYEALSFSEFSDLQLPTEAKLSIFRPDPREFPKIKSQLWQEILIRTTNAIPSISIGSFRPNLPGKTIVSDERFNSEGSFNLEYFTTNDWLTAETVTNSRGYKQARLAAMANPARSGRPAESSRAVRILILATIVAFPIVIWGVSRFSKSG